MPRRDLVNRELDGVERSITRRLSSSPLVMIAEQLLIVVNQARTSVEAGSMSSAQARGVCSSITAMLETLPGSFESRFLFDSALIQSISAEWSQGEVQLSQMIVPRHTKEWGHVTVPMPSANRTRTHVVDVILVPGDDDIEAIDLLEYPWLGHEMGHNLHFRVDRFADLFAPRVNERLTDLRTMSVADRGAAKQRALAATEMIRQVWWPSRDHKNWAHEIAVDIVALWAFGPAFLFAFDDFVDRQEPDPFCIGQVHPPYMVRASALVDAASRLRWGDFTSAMHQRLDKWAGNAPTSYEYAMLADEDLVVAAVTCGLQACQQHQLPRLTAEDNDRLLLAIRNGQLPEFGSDLVVSASLAERELDQTEFDDWHKRVVSELAATATLESPQ